MRFTDTDVLSMLRAHYEKSVSLSSLSEKYQVSRATIQTALNRESALKKYEDELSRRERRAQIKKRVAALKVAEVSPLMIDQIIAIASQSVADTDIKFQYAIHNAAADILNRAGIQAKQEENREIHVVLDSGIELGEPD